MFNLKKIALRISTKKLKQKLYIAYALPKKKSYHL